jgi:thiamine kinase-like enzyme
MNAHANILDHVAALPLWQGIPRFEPLAGGISNLSFVATDRRGKYVVRLTRDFPFHNVYRDREVTVARAAHAAGFAPEVVHAEPGVMVSRFIESRTLRPEDVRAHIARIAELMSRFHREMTTPVGDYAFDVFDVNRGYLRELESTEWAAVNERLAAMQVELPPVFAHHDLLASNILDDGNRLWLIDFEYAGPGSPMFDLANLSSNSAFSAEESAELLQAYFGSAHHARAHRAMEAASLLREALWSLVSARHIHERDVDYVSYAELNLARMREVMRDL